MSVKITRYARTLRRYRVTRRLEQQGAAPAGLYAHHLHGAFGGQVASVRRQLANASAPRLTG
eukprot:6396607-Pyramimonas_sp.AAC.1